MTISRLRAGESVEYLPVNGLTDFDLVLSYTGGEALRTLSTLLGARRVAALYGGVDPEIHRPAAPVPEFAADLSYLGTYAADRQETLERLFIEAARQKPESRFVIGGAQYPSDFPWATNIHFVRHLAPSQHPAFYCSSRLTLNVTRRAMAEMGYCPSGRLFEAAACGDRFLATAWEGLRSFTNPVPKSWCAAIPKMCWMRSPGRRLSCSGSRRRPENARLRNIPPSDERWN